MSVVARNFYLRNEVYNMTTASIKTASRGSALLVNTAYNQTALDLFVARVATALLRWSNRRAIRATISHDDMSRLLANVASTQSRAVYSTLVP